MDAKEIDHFNLLKIVSTNYKKMPEKSENGIANPFSPEFVAKLDLCAADILELQILLGAEYRVNEHNYTAEKREQMQKLMERVSKLKI